MFFCAFANAMYPLRLFLISSDLVPFYYVYPLRVSADFYEWRLCCKWVPFEMSLVFKRLASISKQVPLWIS
jgi:hypothetical protein